MTTKIPCTTCGHRGHYRYDSPCETDECTCTTFTPGPYEPIERTTDMATAPCMNCTHLGRSDHYDGPCTAPGCKCKRYIPPISAARYQALLDWAHTGQDMTNIKGNDLASLVLSYEQVVKGLFELRGILEDIPADPRWGLDSADIVRERMLDAFEKQLRVIFGLEED